MSGCAGFSPRERREARIGLGLPNAAATSCRNWMQPAVNSVPGRVFADLVTHGLALQIPSAWDVLDYRLTPTGAALALEPGETLRPKDAALPLLYARAGEPVVCDGGHAVTHLLHDLYANRSFEGSSLAGLSHVALGADTPKCACGAAWHRYGALRFAAGYRTLRAGVLIHLTPAEIEGLAS